MRRVLAVPAVLACLLVPTAVAHASARDVVRDCTDNGTIDRQHSAQDYKSALQELVQSRNEPLPEYRLIGTVGPDHRKLFQVEVVVNGGPVADATGTSKKEAEQEAARLALERLQA